MGNPYFWPSHCLTAGAWAGHVDTAGHPYTYLFHLRLQTLLFNETVSQVMKGLQSYYLFSAVVVSHTTHSQTVCVPGFTVTEPNNPTPGVLLCINCAGASSLELQLPAARTEGRPRSPISSFIRQGNPTSLMSIPHYCEALPLCKHSIGLSLYVLPLVEGLNGF